MRRIQVEYLGRGGHAEILRAIPPAPAGGAITLKVLRGDLADSHAARTRLERDGEVLARLRGRPGFPQLIRAGRLFGRPCLAYGYIPGLPLDRLWSTATGRTPAPLDPAPARRIGTGLLRRLQILHELDPPVLHGDVSPENILVDARRTVHLIDFGCACTLHPGRVRGAGPVGKPRYLSPEQARGEPWDQRSDLYQAGIVLYELLTARHWNPGRSAGEARVLAAEPPRLDPAAVQREFAGVLARLLAPAPDARYRSARAALAELAGAQAPG